MVTGLLKSTNCSWTISYYNKDSIVFKSMMVQYPKEGFTWVHYNSNQHSPFHIVIRRPEWRSDPTCLRSSSWQQWLWLSLTTATGISSIQMATPGVCMDSGAARRNCFDRFRCNTVDIKVNIIYRKISLKILFICRLWSVNYFKRHVTPSWFRWICASATLSVSSPASLSPQHIRAQCVNRANAIKSFALNLN